MSITIKEIATLAGVSRGTVDRVLNNRGSVSPKSKEKILRIAKEQGYVKNIMASNLAKQESFKIALVLPDPNEDMFWQAPFKGVIKIKDFFSSYGISQEPFFFNVNSSESYEVAFNEAILSKPNAILVAPVFYQETLSYFQMARQNGIKCVCINSEIEHDDILCYIGQNSFQCGVIAGRLFSGVRSQMNKIATITLGHSTKNAIHIESKIEGFDFYNNQNSFAKEIIHLSCENFNHPPELAKFTQNILEQHSDLEGIFFTNSRAYLFLNEVIKCGREIPGNFIVGFDLLEENLQFLEEDKIQILLNQNPMKQGYLGMINLFNYFMYNKEIKKKQYLPVDIVVKENYKNYLEQENYELQLAL